MVGRAPDRTEEELAAFKRRQRDRKTQLQREARQRARESSSQSATGAADRKPSDTQEAASASCPTQQPTQDSSSSRLSQQYPQAHLTPETITCSSLEQSYSAFVQPEKYHLAPGHDRGNMASDPASQQAAEPDPFSDPAERRVFHAALDSFRQYRRAAHYNIVYLRRQSFYSLPSAHMDLLSQPPFSLPSVFDQVDDAIDANADLAEAIFDIALPSFGFASNDESWKGKATPSDMDKARSTLRQFYRDWSIEGLPERHACYSPILAALESYVSSQSPAAGRHNTRVLVPGAGLGRLVFEVCRAGFTVEGNEISYHQLFASNYILNCTEAAGQHKIYPWALNFSNHLKRSAQLQSVAVPDVHPGLGLEKSMHEAQSEVHYSERMSMTAGDFCEIYRREGYKDCFNAVITCFFIDTAPNVLTYIDTIKHCLQQGGIWINLGPLLWHFESAPTPAGKNRERGEQQKDLNSGIGDPGSFELSNDEVLALLQCSGFQICEQKEIPAGATGYIQDPQSMLQNVYRPSFWVARKQ
ncbi:N2227-domain-containing protein [Hortaea werneckii]|nr:N2227-domain-containing protein [Hortaea werneckii]KAI7323370.1 N2227-domain-containing protein [Hortaea werneckii]